jgi:hypothetical protein
MKQPFEPRMEPELVRMAEAIRAYGVVLAQFSELCNRDRQPSPPLSDPLFQKEAMRMLRKIEAAGQRLAAPHPIPVELHAVRPMLMRIASGTAALVTACHVRLAAGDASAFHSARPQVQQLNEWLLGVSAAVEKRQA